MTRTRAQAGALARWSGDVFERWLERQHALAVARGLLAWVRHVSPRVEWKGKGGFARPQVVGEACADYVGQFAGGRALVVEAKSRNVDRNLGLSRSDFKPQQLDHLDACAKHGGLALLVVELRPPGRAINGVRYAIPWLDVPWRRSGRGASVDVTQLDPYRVREGELYLAGLETTRG